MANFTQAFRDEVARRARKQVKSETQQLRRASAQYRRDIAALKRTLADLQRTVDFLRKRESKRVARPETEAPDKSLRFSPVWLQSHREKLGLSAEDYGTLVGVTGQSIYMWEHEKTAPRQTQIAKLAAIRGIGRREAIRRLELIESQ
jgi:DNA-binding XRE family transcriptional regulator